ncbi:hypothetical protein PLICRDRAFT_693101, partial [Plicaturopsis crispa FD-325 SS-3]
MSTTPAAIPWIPKRTLAEADAILCAPGMPHELETILIDGRLQRVYKNLWPTLGAFWLWAVDTHKDREYIVFEGERWTYAQLARLVLKAASVYRHAYGIQKGERVCICARNLPTYLAAFWACHLIGAVAVVANAWLPLDALQYCLTHTGSKLIIVDAERANLLQPATRALRDAGTVGFLVLDAKAGQSWEGMLHWDEAMARHPGDGADVLRNQVEISPEDNATIIFTSGTTGLPKGVLSSHRGYLTNLRNLSCGSKRAMLRRGEDLPQSDSSDQRGILVPVPLFHVTGLTSLSTFATMNGMKIVLMRRWDVEQAVRSFSPAFMLILQEDIGIAGGVPSMVSDLIQSSAARRHRLDALMFGGAAAPTQLYAKATHAFPGALMSQSYGMTEVNSNAVTFAGEDYEARPTSTGLAAPVNDIVIVQDGTVVPPGQLGEVWIRGPNVMKEYWRDPVATERSITKDGWMKTGDLGLLDEEGFLYIRDRLKDIIIRGGENIDSVMVENALYQDARVIEVAAVGVPDQRLGELVTAVVYAQPSHLSQLTESDLIALSRRSLPRFAVPVMILITSEPFARTPSGKITKAQIRKLAKEEWEKRCSLVRDAMPKL